MGRGVTHTCQEDLQLDGLYSILIVLLKELVKHGGALFQVLLCCLELLLLGLEEEEEGGRVQ